MAGKPSVFSLVSYKPHLVWHQTQISEKKKMHLFRQATKVTLGWKFRWVHTSHTEQTALQAIIQPPPPQLFLFMLDLNFICVILDAIVACSVLHSMGCFCCISLLMLFLSGHVRSEICILSAQGFPRRIVERWERWLRWSWVAPFLCAFMSLSITD